jgi:predicted RNase H-like HicB family nuclease
MSELVFDITQEEDGGFCAKAVNESIFTQGDTWEELPANVKDAVEAFYFDGEKPATVRLRLVRDEVLVAG